MMCIPGRSPTCGLLHARKQERAGSCGCYAVNCCGCSCCSFCPQVGRLRVASGAAPLMQDSRLPIPIVAATSASTAAATTTTANTSAATTCGCFTHGQPLRSEQISTAASHCLGRDLCEKTVAHLSWTIGKADVVEFRVAGTAP